MMRGVSLFLAAPADPVEFLFELRQLVIGHIFKIHHLVTRAFDGEDELVELEVKSLGVAVLGILNEKYHQERNDGCAGVDDQLPRIGVMKEGPEERPYDDYPDGSKKSPGAAHHIGCLAGKAVEPMVDHLRRLTVAYVWAVAVFVLHRRTSST